MGQGVLVLDTLKLDWGTGALGFDFDFESLIKKG